MPIKTRWKHGWPKGKFPEREEEMPYEDKSHVGMFQCYFCGEDMGILLDKHLRNKIPRRAGVLNMDPCNTCKGYMEQGIILMSIKNETTPEEMGKGGGMPNPSRTGGWVVVKEEAVERMMDADSFAFAQKNRFMFITDAAWDALGLPRGPVEGVPTK